MPFTLTTLTPLLETTLLRDTHEFYTRVLGFACAAFREEDGWLHLHRDGVSVMFSLPNAHENRPAPIMSGSLYFNTDNVAEAWERLREHCKVCYPMEDFSYGMREFAVYDNNGYLLQFGQPLSPA